MTKLLIIGLHFFGVIAILLITWGTGMTSRYISPPHIIPGVILLHMYATFLAICAVRAQHTWILPLRIWLEGLNFNEGQKLRNMFLTVASVIIIFSVMDEPPLSGRYILFKNYTFSLIVNIVTALMSASGLFGWIGFSLIAKKGSLK